MAFSIEPFRHLYPFRSNFLDLDGLRMHYLDEGAGDAIVMLHGNPTWSFMWRELVKDLRRDHRVVVPDHIGMGLSDKPGDDRYDYTLERRVEDVERLLERLGLRENLTFILHDWGGMIGAAAAVRSPERFRRFVFMNTAAFMLPRGRRLPASLRFVRDSAPAAFLVRGFNAFSAVASRVCCPLRPMTREVRSAFTGPYGSWADRIATLRFVQDIPLGPGDRAYELCRRTQDGLTRFESRPVMIAWGEKDFVFDRHFLAEWTRRFPRAELHRFPDAGHYVLEDEPLALVSRVRRFLAKNPVQVRS